ncbi:hypothetical protein FOCC_FOCC001610 [Frankliniella occidentalis]|nr:hypothetical protein FOCC_FOCC001610 [Frankliniella occidentalis]
MQLNVGPTRPPDDAPGRSAMPADQRSTSSGCLREGREPGQRPSGQGNVEDDLLEEVGQQLGGGVADDDGQASMSVSRECALTGEEAWLRVLLVGDAAVAGVLQLGGHGRLPVRGVLVAVLAAVVQLLLPQEAAAQLPQRVRGAIHRTPFEMMEVTMEPLCRPPLSPGIDAAPNVTGFNQSTGKWYRKAAHRIPLAGGAGRKMIAFLYIYYSGGLES